MFPLPPSLDGGIGEWNFNPHILQIEIIKMLLINLILHLKMEAIET
jgi:hypothetical protein